MADPHCGSAATGNARAKNLGAPNRCMARSVHGRGRWYARCDCAMGLQGGCCDVYTDTRWCHAVNANVALQVWRAAQCESSRPAILERDTSVDYGQLLQRVAAIATALVGAGATPGDPVAILLDRG